jgi:hypothetical protein
VLSKHTLQFLVNQQPGTNWSQKRLKKKWLQRGSNNLWDACTCSKCESYSKSCTLHSSGQLKKGKSPTSQLTTQTAPKKKWSAKIRGPVLSSIQRVLHIFLGVYIYIFYVAIKIIDRYYIYFNLLFGNFYYHLKE